MKIQHLRKIFVLQSAPFDCGVACLKSIFRYYGTDVGWEELRLFSGTAHTGTTMLGLYQCAQRLGFEVEAGELEPLRLFSEKQPVILYVINRENAGHYLVYFGKGKIRGNGEDRHVIGDPATGILTIGSDELLAMWASRGAMLLKPASDFVSRTPYSQRKRKWLLGHIQSDPQLLIGIILMTLIITLLGFAATLFSQKLIDILLPGRDFTRIAYGLVLLMVVMAGRTVLYYLRSLFINRYGIRFQESFVGAIAEKVVFKPLSFFLAFSAGEILSRFGEAGKLQKTIIYLSAVALIDLLYLVFGITYLTLLSKYIGLITILFVPMLALPGIRYSKKLFIANQVLLNTNSKFEQAAIDGVQGHPVYRENNRESFLLVKLKERLQDVLRASDHLNRTAARFQFVGDILSSVLYFSIIALAAYQVFEKLITIGEIVVIFSIQASLSLTLQRLISSALVLQEGQAASEKIFDLTGDEVTSPPPLPSGSVSLDNLTVHQLVFGFPGRRALLKDISFSVAKGRSLAITGKSGCGKSLLMQLLIGSLPLSSGQIICTIDGMAITVPLDRRGLIGHVPQQVYVFEGTLLENITMDSSDAAKDSALSMCSVLGFNRFFETLPQGFDTMVGANHFQLSGGQKQLLGIARALYKKPGLLLLDEATSAMDSVMAEVVKTAIGHLKNGMILIWITHDNSLVNYCDEHLHIVQPGNT